MNIFNYSTFINFLATLNHAKLSHVPPFKILFKDFKIINNEIDIS